MNDNALSPEGDLPPNHPLVLEALKGIIAGPISELRTSVDNLITNPSTGLQKGTINYNNILPLKNTQPASQPQIDHTSLIANNILNSIAPTNYMGQPQPSPFTPQVNAAPAIQPTAQIADPNQPELPLFKPTELSDIYKKIFDIELKLDIIIKHVKGNQSKKQS